MAAVTIVQVGEDFDKQLDSSGLIVVHFSAQWAPQCRQMEEVLTELARDAQLANNVKFLQVEAESFPEQSQKYDVTAVPTFILLRNKRKVATVNGANAPELTKIVRRLANVADVVMAEPYVAPAPSTADDLNTRLKQLITAAPCVLFMKGTPKEPKCGFSRQIIQILDKFNTNYGSFDILSDEKVRQGLKEYSNWPTYPQLYVNGALIGGLDIVNELNESGELEAMLPKKSTLNDKLKSLVNRAPIMVFMKGDRMSPQCGFSKQLVAILNDVSAAYETFDILRDEEVRQGLKTYSNWPTYPQVYVGGELIGGLDIVKELKESGELLSALKPSK